jgi:hypothetical protein
LYIRNLKRKALFAIIALTAGCIDATAQNKKKMKSIILTSHSELGTQEKKQDFGQKNLPLLRVSRQRSNH